MSLVNQTPRRNNMVRTVVAGSVAALLLGSSFYAAQAGSNSDYGDGSLDGGEIAAITLGGVGGIAIVMGVMNDRKDDDDASAAKSKTAKVEQLRVVPAQTRLGVGDATTVEVQARYQGSKTWEKVTNSASVQLVSGGLTQVDGSSNAFAVPYGSKVVPGDAVIKASFGGVSAATTVSVN